MALSRIYRWSEVMNMVVLIIQVDSVTIPIQKKFNIKHSFRGKTLASFQNYLYLCIRLIKIEV